MGVEPALRFCLPTIHNVEANYLMHWSYNELFNVTEIEVLRTSSFIFNKRYLIV